MIKIQTVKKLRRYIVLAILCLCSLNLFSKSRIKDVTTLDGNRANALIGYGIVSGLDGKGDSSMDYTTQSILNALKQFGVVLPDTSKPKARNIAAVMVVTDMQVSSREGTRIDVIVSSIGDAKSLQGGVLLQTPLKGPDNIVYAVAQGPVAIGGFLGGGGEGESSKVQQNHPTVGRIAGGAIIEREIKADIIKNGSLNLNLINADYTTAVRIADAINEKYNGIAKAENNTTVNVLVPENFIKQIPNFLANIESIEFIPDMTAKIVINEKTGTIVATKDVRISEVAVSHGSLTITVTNNKSVSQPEMFSKTGETKEITNTNTQVENVQSNFKVIKEFPRIEELTAALNAMGATTREVMAILQAIKAAGSLQAELVVI